ncbi:MAG: Fic family protein [Gemmatimonadaceae bacterium]
MKLPVSPPPLSTLFIREFASESGAARLAALAAHSLGPAPAGKYRHWDTFRHAAPLAEYSAEAQWMMVKIARRALYRPLPLNDTGGTPFQIALPNPALSYLHRIDRFASGSIQGPEQVTDPSTRDTYLFKSLVEEAITSSQLEGASTTRRVAKAMIQEGRDPRDRSEKMILNNYLAMRFLLEKKDEPLTPALILELQARLTDGTLDEPDAVGRLRRADDEIVVEDDTGRILHTPPDAAELPERLERLCAFANAVDDAEFLPPAVRAIVLHFWLAYDHPFVDGNGRTARALFYWAMARYGYWLCEFVSISRILKKARGQYLRSFLYTESDENDATYFVLYQLRVLCRAIDDLHAFLADRSRKMRETELLVLAARSVRQELNVRQLALIRHALHTSNARYTVESHRISHGVTYETARTDLLKLAQMKLLSQGKSGRLLVYRPAQNLRSRLSAVGALA